MSVCGSRTNRSNTSAIVGIAAVTEPDNHDDQLVVFDRVDDAVVTHTDAKAGAPTQGSGSGWPRILSQKGDGSLNATTHLWIHLAQRSCRRWAEVRSGTRSLPAQILLDLFPRNV